MSEQCSFIGDHFYAYGLQEADRRCKNRTHADNNRCKFHIEEYVKDEKNRDELVKELEDRLERANSSGQSLMWIGYYIPNNMIFDHNFEGTAYLSQAKFLGNVDFSRVEFKGKVNFRGATFSGKADFREAIFHEEADFLKAVFHQKADFSYTTTFNKEAVFHSATFYGEADFSYKSSVPLEEEETNYRAKFREKASFFNATFEKDAKFSQDASDEQNFSLFQGEADYMHAKFHGYANFRNASAILVGGSLQLTESPTFNNGVRFFNTMFGRNASFSYTIFNGNVNFSYSEFKEQAYFSGARFREVNFSQVKFGEVTNFSNAQFNGKASFSNAQFNGKVSFIDNPIMENMIFTQVFLKDQTQVTFNGNLSNVSFANTDITRVQFGDKVRWRKAERNSKDERSKEEKSQGEANGKRNKTSMIKMWWDKIRNWWHGEESDFKIYDERILEGKEEAYEPRSSLQSIITEYRNLRENYEYNLRYKEAGQFFIREIELDRIYEQKLLPSTTEDDKIKKRPFYKRWLSFANMYYIVSKYGESPRIPLLVIVSTFIVATTLFFWFERFWSWETFTASISRSLEAFFPFFELQDERGLGDMMLRLTMLPMVGLLFLALRRRLERRFRH